MTQSKAAFIKIEGIPPGFEQTRPVEPEKRLPESEIRIEVCDEFDAEKIAEAMYTIFPAVFWDRREPPDLRPAPPVRLARMAERVKPTLSIPTITWIKAIHAPTSEFMGLACWTQPDNPSIHNLWGRSAIKHYGLQEKMNWTDEQIRDMWAGVDEDAWDKEITLYDKAREEVLKDERHWFLAPLMVYPEYQGRGVGHRLLDWAIEQADATVPPTPLYLESAQTARAVYLHCGFVPCGKVNMARRGPPKD